MFNWLKIREKRKYADLNALVVVNNSEMSISNLIQMSGAYSELKNNIKDLQTNYEELIRVNSELNYKLNSYEDVNITKDKLKHTEIRILNYIRDNNIKLNRTDLINNLVENNISPSKPTAYSKLKKLLKNNFLFIENDILFIKNYE